MTKDQAEKCARTLCDYWRRQGHNDVTAWPVKEPWVNGVNTPGWGIRSNLVNGLPPSLQKNKDALP